VSEGERASALNAAGRSSRGLRHSRRPWCSPEFAEKALAATNRTGKAEREREGVGELTGTAKGGRGGLIHRDVARLVCSASAVVFLTV
jgi:hypothetical protein